MSTVVVTGGAGYIGSHAVLALAGAAISQVLRTSGAEAVLHFAARLSVGESVRDPLGYYRTNVIGTLTLLEAMVGAGISRFVFSSTAATFGEPDRVPIDEAHPQRPINPYGESKLAVERALKYLDGALGLRSIALRYFNAAGADPGGLIGEDHEPELHLIPLAIHAAQGGTPLTVFGGDYPTPDGTCVRDYIHVTDLAEAHVLALRALEGGAPSNAYNLGNGDGISVKALIESVERVGDRRVPHIVGPRRPGDPARLVASSQRARDELGWRPRLDRLDQIVDTAWRWHERHPTGYGDRAGSR